MKFQLTKLLCTLKFCVKEKNLILITNKRKKFPSSIDAGDSIKIRTTIGWPTSTYF